MTSTDKLNWALTIGSLVVIIFMLVNINSKSNQINELQKNEALIAGELNRVKDDIGMRAHRSLCLIEQALDSGLVTKDNESVWAEYALSIPGFAGDMKIFREKFEGIIERHQNSNRLIDVMKSNKHIWFGVK